MTRAKALESLCCWALAHGPGSHAEVLAKGMLSHIAAAREAAMGAKPLRRLIPIRSSVAQLERAVTNLDAAEATLINFAPPDYVLGQLSSLLRHVQAHLKPTDPRRQELERISQRLGVTVTDHAMPPTEPAKRAEVYERVDQERGRIATITRAANSESSREQVRMVRFLNFLLTNSMAMTLIAIAVAAIGFANPNLIVLCFAPEESGQTIVVCPTKQSALFPTVSQPSSTPSSVNVNDLVLTTVSSLDLLTVELVDLFGAAVALNMSAQILAWALLFGYAQQLFTRLIDRQGQTVLDSVRGTDKSPSQS